MRNIPLSGRATGNRNIAAGGHGALSSSRGSRRRLLEFQQAATLLTSPSCHLLPLPVEVLNEPLGKISKGGRSGRVVLVAVTDHKIEICLKVCGRVVPASLEFSTHSRQIHRLADSAVVAGGVIPNLVYGPKEGSDVRSLRLKPKVLVLG